MKIHELLRDGNWTKGHNALAEDGRPTHPLSPWACSFCLAGAAIRCYPSDAERYEVLRKLHRGITGDPLPPGYLGCVYAVNDWNDAKERRVEDVLALAKETDV